jgi:hypothetical protein
MFLPLSLQVAHRFNMPGGRTESTIRADRGDPAMRLGQALVDPRRENSGELTAATCRCQND